MRKIVIGLLIGFLLFGCERSNSDVELIKIINDVFDYGQRDNVKISDNLVIVGGVFVDADEKIDTLNLGSNKLQIKYKDKNNKIKKYTYSYIVADSTKPMILHKSKYVVKRGSASKILDDIICGDNHDKTLVCEIKGEYDLNKIGDYAVNFYAKDEAGNETVSPFTIVVKDEIKSSLGQSSVKEVNISDFISAYKTDNTLIGIDVSSWQGDIDFEKVKEAGVSFVFIRVGFADSKGNITLDNKFDKNIKEARNAGLKVGVYFYSKASTIKMAREQALYVIDALNGEEIALPIAFDWECWNDFNEFMISYTDLNLIAEEFIKTCQKNGYKAMNYGSASYLEKVWNIDEYLVWMAHYTSKSDFAKKYYVWQASNVGVVPGIDGFVDLDVLYK